MSKIENREFLKQALQGVALAKIEDGILRGSERAYSLVRV